MHAYFEMLVSVLDIKQHSCHSLVNIENQNLIRALTILRFDNVVFLTTQLEFNLTTLLHKRSNLRICMQFSTVVKNMSSDIMSFTAHVDSFILSDVAEKNATLFVTVVPGKAIILHCTNIHIYAKHIYANKS